jgi:hypothetical protein
MMADVKLGPVVKDLRQASTQARDLFADLRSGETGKQLRSTLTQVNDLAYASQQFVFGLQATIDRLDHTVANLERLTEDLRAQPSRLLFSNPPEPRRLPDENE